MAYSVKQLADLVGVSVRTLHYYDEIGLLKPAYISEAGYRYYHQDAVSLLQQILFYRSLGFSLKEIAAILSAPHHDKQQALLQRRELLELQKKHIEEMILLVDQTLGGSKMEHHPSAFAELEQKKQAYAKEAKERWGSTKAYKQSLLRPVADHAGQQEFQQKADALFAAVADNRDKHPSDPVLQNLVKTWQQLISDYCYDCSDGMLSCLGQLYQSDARFAGSIDRFGKGTAQLLSRCIDWYCSH